MTHSAKMLQPFFAALIVLVAALQPARADAYLLGPMDKLNIRVVEWQTTEAAIRDWSSISGEYIVGPSGDISMPFIGQLEAAGRTTAEVAEAIGDGLQQKLGLLDRPEASVEMAEFRPIFLAGDVATPGGYPFAPNLTVLKAVTLAGGLRRASDAGLRVERDFINASGEREVLEAERVRLIAKRARLSAEASGSGEIEFPEELRETEDGQRLISSETAFMAARSDRLALQLAEIDNLKNLLGSEIDALEQKLETQNRQIDLAREELEGIGNLAERGLVVNERVLSLERSIADLEGKVLDMETAALRAKQDIAEATQDATALKNERDSEVARELQETEAALEEINLKILTSNQLMMEALSHAPDLAQTAATGPQVAYTIVRTVEGAPEEMAADETTPVQPGDVVKVQVETTVGQ